MTQKKLQNEKDNIHIDIGTFGGMRPKPFQCKKDIGGGAHVS